MAALDMQADQLTITNNYLAEQADALEGRREELLRGKQELALENREWRQTEGQLRQEMERGNEETRQWRSKVKHLGQ